MTVQTTFGQDLKAWRTDLGLTQTQAAHLLAIGQSWYSKLEKDTNPPGHKVIERFSALRHSSSQQHSMYTSACTALLEELRVEAGRRPKRTEEALRIAVSLIRFVNAE
ncbi:helix-turn-helix transcriptional regulator [Azospirillum sp. B21]|uniref:helix-turn-helix domain-containing protein n=1 Tax=Azospirillum sp. B21 TaxID=2607496 RepID=UPI00165EEA92|nr:helix-turn-helix transcriptional regulator [Azospirillum sp. B21]